MLNFTMIDSLHRSLMSMELDSHLRMVLLKSNKDFCVGTDYLCKIHLDMAHTAQKNPEIIEDYLRQLYSLVWDMSKIEKPLVPLLTGRVYGSGAVIAWLSHFSIASQTAQVCFPESKFGFIPTGGASYLLSRLPGELGLYLALTSQKLHGTDLQNLKVSHSTAEISSFLQNTLFYDVNSQTGPLPVQIQHGDAWRERTELLSAYSRDQGIRDTLEIANRTNMTSFFRNNPENMKMTIADVLYSKKIREEVETTAPGMRYKDFDGQKCQNFLKEFEESYVELLERVRVKPLSIHEHLPAIHRCFSAGSVQEIIERLVYEKEHGQRVWAEQVLKTLSNRSPLGLEMIFRLMRKADESEWSECLQNEFKMALNLSKHPEFTENAKRVLSRVSSEPEWTTKFPVSTDLIEELSENKAELQIDSKKGQLLPVKEYFREFPHNPRCWINEISPTSLQYRRDFELESRSFLNSKGFDIRDYNMEIPVVREKIYLHEKIKKQEQDEESRINNLANDMISVKLYIKTRNEAIQRFVSDDASCQEQVKKALEAKFQKSFDERVQTIRNNSVEAHKIKKRELFREMKDYIEENILIEGLPEVVALGEKLGAHEMEKVPLTFPKRYEDSYLPGLVNKEYPQYTPKNDEFYTADIARMEDGPIYYPLREERFMKKSELREKDIINVIAEEYMHLQLKDLKNNEQIADMDADDIEAARQAAREEIKNGPFEDIKMFDAKKLPTNPEEPEKPFEFELDHRDNRIKSPAGLLYSADLTDLAESEATNSGSVPIPIAVPKKFFSLELEKKLFADRETLKDLIEDVYVKTGCNKLEQGIQLLRTGKFEYDPEAMKTRRREIINKKYIHDDRFYQDEERSKMRQMFTDNLIVPNESDLTNKMYRELEMGNSKVIISKLKQVIENRELKGKKVLNFNKHPSIDKFLNEFNQRPNNYTVPRSVKQFGGKLRFENDYLKIIFGDKTYLPFNLPYEEGDEKELIETLGFCDFKLTGDEWVQKTLGLCIDHLFEQRKVEEMQLTSAELWAYDQDFSENFTTEGVRKLLENYLHQEILVLSESRETNLRAERKEADDFVSAFKGTNDSTQEWLNKNPDLRDTIEAYSIASKMKRIENPKKKKISTFDLYKKDPYIDVLLHELKHGLVKGPGEDPDVYLEKWEARERVDREEMRSYRESKKRTLSEMRDELETTVMVMKNMQELLKKYKFRKTLDDPNAFKKILENNKNIF